MKVEANRWRSGWWSRARGTGGVPSWVPVGLWAGVMGLAVVEAAAPAGDGLAAVVRQRFQQLDTNRDGRLSAAEMKSPALFRLLDTDGDGWVTRAEAEAFGKAVARPGTGGAAGSGSGPAGAGTNGSFVAPLPVPGPHVGVGRRVEEVAFTDLTGRPGRLSEYRSHKALVIAFTDVACPLTRKYGPTLAAMEASWTNRGVAFLLVDPSGADTVEELRSALRARGQGARAVLDTNGVFQRALGATVSTEVFVLDAAATLVYRGAIDDQYGLGFARETPRERYLQDALVAATAGTMPSVRATTAQGCLLETAPGGALAGSTSGRSVTPAAVGLEVTYHNRISRLVQEHCGECHRRGGVAPFPLETLAEVNVRAKTLRREIERGAMPPWFAAPTPAGHPSPWANDRTLPAEDRRDLIAWLSRSDRPEGNPADAPLPRRYPSEWTIGEPDAVLALPKPIAIKASGTMPYQQVWVETDFKEDRWVEAMEIRPTAREVVHHVLVFVRPPAAPGAARERVDDTVLEQGGFFAVYVPGNASLSYPPGFAKALPAGSRLLFQIHYTPNGTATTDQLRLGLRFARQAPEHVVRVAGILNLRLNIPPGAADHVETARLPVPFEARILSFLPHLHVRGKSFRYEVVRPDGARSTLLDVPRYDFNWQLHYRLAEPATVPAGSRLIATAVYDNSERNPANPDPRKTVRWGPQTHDEMLLGYVEYYLPWEAAPRSTRRAGR